MGAYPFISMMRHSFSVMFNTAFVSGKSQKALSYLTLDMLHPNRSCSLAFQGFQIIQRLQNYGIASSNLTLCLIIALD